MTVWYRHRVEVGTLFCVCKVPDTQTHINGTICRNVWHSSNQGLAQGRLHPHHTYTFWVSLLAMISLYLHFNVYLGIGIKVLCSPGCPQTLYAAKDDFEFLTLLLPQEVLRFQAPH